jgi:transposase
MHICGCVVLSSLIWPIQWLLDYLEEEPTAYYDEMQQELFDEFGIAIGHTQLHKYLKNAGWSRKAVKSRAVQRNEALCMAWQGFQQVWRPDQLVFLDESAANERTGDRKYGWAPIGHACQVVSTLKRSERWSLLPALDLGGYMTWLIVQGSIDAEIFFRFLRDRVLPLCEPYPGQRSIIVMDNASIHKRPEIRELIESYGVRLEFLPPYSPQYNPIESSFKDLKTWIKKHFREVSNFESFEAFLADAVVQNCQKDMSGHFRHCGYYGLLT